MIEFIQNYFSSDFDFFKVCVLIGTVTGFFVLLFEIQQKVAMWYVNIISATALGINFYHSDMYAYAIFQVYYVITSFYGIYVWISGKNEQGEDMPPRRLYAKDWLLLAVVVPVVVFLLYHALSLTQTDVAFWDACITALAIVGTFLLARKVYEHWLFWMVSDIIYIVTVLMTSRSDLYLTVLLYSCYIIMACIGLWTWKKKMEEAQ